jgi:hypothetical protein
MTEVFAAQEIFASIVRFLNIGSTAGLFMGHFTSPAIQTVHADRRRIGLIALWARQLALAGMFVLAGSSKLMGEPAMIGLFEAVGVASGSGS